MMTMDTEPMCWGFWRRGRASKGSVCGVAPECSLLPIKVLDKNGNGVQENVIRAIDWILEHKETYSIRIVNISVGTISSREGHERTFRGCGEGLGRRDCGSGSRRQPGTRKRQHYCTGVQPQNHYCGFLGYAGKSSGAFREEVPQEDCISKPDIVAPGNEISSCANKNMAFPYCGKKWYSPCRTPAVSGGIALLLEKHPEYTNLEIKKRLKSRARDLGYPHNLRGGTVFLDDFLRES